MKAKKDSGGLPPRRSVTITVLSLLVCLVGCAPTKQARSVETSGFLGDLYPMMRKGVDGEALLIYKSAKVASIPRGTYTHVLLDHAEIVEGRGGGGGGDGGRRKGGEGLWGCKREWNNGE